MTEIFAVPASAVAPHGAPRNGPGRPAARPAARALALAAILATLSGAAVAQSRAPMTAEEFDAYVTGKTLYYSSAGTPYGAETYLEGRQVIWAFSEDVCQRGVWYPQGDQICFDYDDQTTTQCWIFTRAENGLSAQFMNDGGTGAPLVEVQQSARPLGCAAPALGV